MAVWPVTLPQFHFNRMQLTEASAVVRTPMSSGPAKVRRQFTAAPRFTRERMVLTDAQLDTFQSFFRTTIARGALRFDWVDPENGNTVEFRFTREPRWILNGPVWEATLELEILP